MRIKLIILLTFCATVLFGQEFSKKDFKDTHWFTNNLDSLFFEADTITMIKVLDKGPKWMNYEYQEDEHGYLGHCKYVTLEFSRRRRFDYWVRLGCSRATVSWAGNKWLFDEEKQMLVVFEKETPFFTLRPLDFEKITLESHYPDNNGIRAEKWIFERIKN
jgi:hypothetical protein